MSVFSMAGSNPALPTYPLQRSVRLRSSASAYFRRANVTSTSTTTWTYSFWLKRGSTIGTQNNISGAGPSSGTSYSAFLFDSSNAFQVNEDTGGASTFLLITTQVFRDPAAWYHFVVTVDTTQATASNRVKIYVNGVQVTAFSTAIYPSLNYATYFNNATYTKAIGNIWYNGAPGGFYYDGYLEEVNFIDGQALTPSSFGAFNSYGVWSPAKYTGSYGNNGFYLSFQDNSTVTTTVNVGIGADSSGNGNYWTSNNISLTSGFTYDSMLDVPTSSSTTNANFAVLNPLITGNVIPDVNGNLQASLAAGSNAYFNSVGTIAVTSGKWYWECTVNSKDAAAGQWIQFGIVSATTTYTNNALGFPGNMSAGYSYFNDGFKAGNGTTGAYGASYTNGDVIGVAFDADAGTITYYKNGTSQGQAFSGISNAVPWLPIIQIYRSVGTNQRGDINFGQQPFAYTVPTGYARLNTYNLSDSIVPVGAQYFAATLYTATGTTPQTITNTVNGVSIQPDLVWTKSRSTANNNILNDSVRGSQYYLYSNLINAENNDATYLTSFNSNGFSLGTGNFANGTTMVGWQWRASNASAVTNTAGSITSSVSANQTAGFSIVTYTGTGANATVGHGLGVTPRMVITKGRTTTFDWRVWFYTFATGFDIQLNSTAAVSSAPTVYTSAPSSTVINIGSGSAINQSAATYVAYCFAAVPGYSAFGSYTGNGSTDGPFVFTGFLPRFVLTKRSDSTGPWQILDSSRDTYNSSIKALFPNTSGAEANFTQPNGIDFLSNGFKLRNSSTDDNASGGTYIYAAFAENPFKNSLAR